MDRGLGAATMLVANGLELAGKAVKLPFKILSGIFNTGASLVGSKARWKMDYSLTSGWKSVDDGRKIFRRYLKGACALPAAVIETFTRGIPYLFAGHKFKSGVYKRTRKWGGDVLNDVGNVVKSLGCFNYGSVADRADEDLAMAGGYVFDKETGKADFVVSDAPDPMSLEQEEYKEKKKSKKKVKQEEKQEEEQEKVQEEKIQEVEEKEEEIPEEPIKSEKLGKLNFKAPVDQNEILENGYKKDYSGEIKEIEEEINKKKKDSFDKDSLELKNLERKKEYYRNENIVNKVDLDQVQETFSISRKNMMKQGLVHMADNDLDQEFEKENSFSRSYRAFLKKLITYGRTGADYVSERLENGQYIESTENREKEIDAFLDAQNALDALIKKADSAYMLDKLEGYRRMLSGLSDGALEVPKNAEIVYVRGAIRDKEGKLAVNVIDRKDVPLFAHEPSIQDVDQGKVGDCYLVSTLSSIVAAEPQVIKNMMKDNGDGTVTVRFMQPTFDVDAKRYGLTSEPIYINVPKQTLGNKGGRNALWVNVFALAYTGYRRQIWLRGNAIEHLERRLKGSMKSEFKAEKDRITEKVRSRLAQMYPKAEPNDYFYPREWTITTNIESFIKGKSYEKIYKDLISQSNQMEVNRDIKADVIEAGQNSEIIDAISGRIHTNISICGKAHISHMNTLAYVFDNMPDVAELKVNDSRTRALAKNLVRQYLKGYNAEKENRKLKDGEETNNYYRYITRQQMAGLVMDAQKSFVSKTTMRQVIDSLDDKTYPELKEIKRLQKSDPEAFEFLISTADNMCSYFLENAEKNTILSYERFSGQYTDKAKEIFKEIEKAVKDHKVVFGSTYQELVADKMDVGQSGEPVFEGIASKHAYSIMGTKRIKDKDGKEHLFIRVRNPWGLSHTIYEKDKDGKIVASQTRGEETGGMNEIELNHFMERFRKIGYVGVEDLKPVNQRKDT